MSGALDGSTIALIGASGCYGAAIARALAREGASLVLGARSRETLEVLQQELDEGGARTLVIGTDVTRLPHLERIVEVALESFGDLDAVVYAARCSQPSPMESLDVEDWGSSVDVNVRGFLYAAGAALPAMLERGGGHIVDLDASTGDGALVRSGSRVTREALEELDVAFSERGLLVSQVRPGDSPERGAEAVLRALTSPPRELAERLQLQG